MKKIKRWFIGLPFAILLSGGLLLAYVYKLRTGKNVVSEFAALMEPVKKSWIVDGVAEGIEALSTAL